jgi:xanthine dehydrogenase molybdopterin-binding subunit B
MGGAYGGKARPASHVAAAAAIAASKLNKPVRLIMDIKSNMQLMGKRFPYFAKYNVRLRTFCYLYIF